MVSQWIANPSSGLNRYLGSSPSVGVRTYMMTTYEYKVGFRHQLVLIHLGHAG